MAFRVEGNREYLEKALDYAQGAATRASNQAGLNPLIREIHQKDAKAFLDMKTSITEVK